MRHAATSVCAERCSRCSRCSRLATASTYSYFEPSPEFVSKSRRLCSGSWMPVLYYRRPASVKEAQVFVGTPVQVYWLKTPESPEGWYPGTVAQVYWGLEEESGQETRKKRLYFHVEYEDDSEDLEWNEVFNGAPMTDKTDVRGNWSTDALALLDGLAASPAKHRSAGKKRVRAATSKQSVGDATQHHSESSQAGPATAFGVSHESHSPQQHSNMSQASPSPGRAGGHGHQPPSLSENVNLKMGEEVDHLHAGGTADSLPFGSGQWQGAPAGPSMQESGDDVWEGTANAPQKSPNKRRRTQDDGTASGRAPSRRQHRDAPVARFTEVLHPGPGVGTSGQIAKIRLENFMCHDNLEIALTPHVNFISGSNGSGKSASLQALQCCLGVKARATGRASKVDQFIKTGCSHAIAAVSLWNTGHDAFNPTVYGSIITIERRITKASSTFTLKDAAGRKVGEGKSEVDEVVEHFNICAGNPAVCMTQFAWQTFTDASGSDPEKKDQGCHDTARSFAGTHDDKQKFKLYMEATHFDETTANLNAAESHVGGMRDILLKQSEHVKEKQRQLEGINQKVEGMHMVERWQLVQASYHRVIAWQQHAEIAQLVDKEKQRFDSWPEKMAKLDDAARQAAESLAQLEREHQDQRQALQDFKPRMAQMTEQSRQQHAAARAAAKDLHTAQLALQTSQGEAQELEEEKQSLQQLADTMQQSLASNSQAAVSKHAASIKAQQRTTEAASANATLARQAVREADAAVEQATKHKTQQEAAARDANGRVQTLIVDLDRLQQSQRNPVTAFMPARCSAASYSTFLQRVQQASAAGRFHRKPIGPIGASLSLQDENWALAVEVAVGSAFNTFVVHDFADQATLKQIANQSNMGALVQVFICSFNLPPSDIHSGRVPLPPAHLQTVLKVLSFPDDVGPIIRNALIIQRSIERLVLVDSESQAMQLVRAQTGQQGPAGQAIGRCYTKDGGQAYGRKQTETWIPPQHPHPRLSRNLAGQIIQVQAELQAAQAAAEAAARALETARAEVREAKQIREQAVRGKQRAEREKNTAESQLDELTSQQPEDADTTNTALQDALKAIFDKDAEIRLLQQKLESLAEEVDSASAQSAAAKAACAELEQRRQQLLLDNAACESAIGDVFSRKEEAVQAVAYYSQKRQEWHAAIDAAQKQLQEHTQQQEAVKQQAEQVCSYEEGCDARHDLIETWQSDGWPQHKIEETLQVDMLTKRSAAVAARIAQKEKDAGSDLDTLRAMQRQLQNQVGKLELKYCKVESAHRLLKDGVKRRKLTSAQIRTTIEQEANEHFMRYLHRKQFQGRIKLHYPEELMELKILVAGEATKDMKSLSGGERSFITVCFMLALARVISSPFHCMDEFDVFMDAIIRRVSMTTLLHFAIENSDTQLILLSPQDITAIEEAKHQVQREKGFPTSPDSFLQIRQMQHQRHGADHS